MSRGAGVTSVRVWVWVLPIGKLAGADHLLDPAGEERRVNTLVFGIAHGVAGARDDAVAEQRGLAEGDLHRQHRLPGDLSVTCRRDDQHVIAERRTGGWRTVSLESVDLLAAGTYYSVFRI